MGRTIFKGVLAAVVALLVLVLYLFGVNALVLLFGGALFFGGLRFVQQQWKSKQRLNSMLAPVGIEAGRFAWKAALPMLGTGLLAASTPFSLLVLFLTFLKLGAVVYGSGYTLLAFLRTDLVQNLHWLTDKQLLDAVSVGQFTPGPVFTTATFIGYLLGGLPGAVLATLAIFLPSFLFIALIHPVASRLRKAAWTATLLDGVNAAAMALMTGVLVQLGQHALTDVLTWAVALVSLAILVRWKINSVWLILAGAAIGLCAFGCWEAKRGLTREFSSCLCARIT